MMSDRAEDRLYRRIVEESGDAVIFADREGVIRIWNRGAEAIFGYSAREALGASLDIIIPENLRERHWTGYKRVMETGSTRYGSELLAVPAVHKNGARISIEFSVSILRSPGGEILGSAAILRDVTDRRRREKTLKDRVAALEKQIGGRP